VTGSDPREQNSDHAEEWFVLKDEMTDSAVGFVDASGHTRDTDAETAQRVTQAFSRELLVQEGEVVEELGICFDGVCSIGPTDPAHDALVLRNLGALTGLRPERQASGDMSKK
jgi:hypothetical protein